MEIYLQHQSEIKDYVKEVIDFAEGVNIWLFVGEMGTGKTSLIKEICLFLDVKDEVSSPTYSIVNEYFSDEVGTIYHFDCYRLEEEREIIDIGLEDYFYSGYPCFIEWPEKVEQFIPESYLLLKIDKLEDGRRKLNISKHV